MEIKLIKRILPLTLLFLGILSLQAQDSSEHSIARQWNELLLKSIRNDFARPSVHTRNLYHISMAMYDAWAVYNEEAETVLLGKTIGDFSCSFDSIPPPEDVEAAQIEAMSYASYRLLRHRFQYSFQAQNVLPAYDSLMADLGFDPFFFSTNYTDGSPAALGNYIADCMIDYGFQDGANEQNLYENQYYEAANPPLVIIRAGNPDMINPNRWQSLVLKIFIDAAGNEIIGPGPDFLSPEWGKVEPFSLTADELSIYERDGHEYEVYCDPGAPPYLTGINVEPQPEDYQWGFALVALWSSHLDPNDGVTWDISPANLGNIPIDSLPNNIDEFKDFYHQFEGGDIGTGHAINPHTGEAYESQIIPRADYARVLAEFWADNPNTPTSSSQWFTILNYVNDHPLFEKKFKGVGEPLDDLEWDVKAYFTLGATLHDCAVAAWGIKGWYDYTSPVSAIRRMAEFGQSTDTSLSNYHSLGLPLFDGFIEVVEEGDSLAAEVENIGEIKLKAWRGPDYISDADTSTAGVDWILAKEWWPYQYHTSHSSLYAGYVSEHSVFSRAAAEVMATLTGDPFFPGGIGEFEAPKDSFLVFEEGPSVDVTLQWATYKDAADQASLSAIWGGLHPPADDIPGRLIGKKIGLAAFSKAESYFYLDADNDGYYQYVDCDDNNPAVNPGMSETCNGLDSNCNGLIDDNLSTYRYFLDADGDGFGDATTPLDTCLETAPVGFVIDSLDCNDMDMMINPAMEEIANNEIDEDCDGEDLISSIVEIDGQPILIYPNPVQAVLTIELKNNNDYLAQVYHLTGTLLLEQNLNKYDNQINFTDWHNGIYLLKISSVVSNEVIVEKIKIISAK